MRCSDVSLKLPKITLWKALCSPTLPLERISKFACSRLYWTSETDSNVLISSSSVWEAQEAEKQRSAIHQKSHDVNKHPSCMLLQLFAQSHRAASVKLPQQAFRWIPCCSTNLFPPHVGSSVTHAFAHQNQQEWQGVVPHPFIYLFLNKDATQRQYSKSYPSGPFSKSFPSNHN